MSLAVRPRTALVAVSLAAVGAVALAAAPAATAAATPPGGSIVPIAPHRIIDTRSSSPGGLQQGRLHPTIALPGVPTASISAVLMNVTVVDAVAQGWIRLGDGTGTSNGNFVARAPSATLVLVPLQHSDIDANYVSFVASTRVSLTADVQGYVSSSTGTTSTFTPLVPKRIADSRSSTGLAPFTANQVQTLVVRGRASLPVNATAVIANVTVTKPTASTYVTGWSGVGTKPTVSTVNAGAGTTVANRAVLPVDSAGRISLYNFNGRADVIVDVVGYLSPDAAGSYYVPAAAATRLTDHSGERITLTPPVPGGSGVTTTAVWVTLASAATTPGYLVAGATVTLPSPTSDLNLQTGRAVANAGPVMLTSTGSFTVASAPSSRFVVDLGGWFQKAAA